MTCLSLFWLVLSCPIYYIISYITWLHPRHLLIPNGFPNLHRGRVQAQQLSEQSGLSTLHGWWWGAPIWWIQWGYDGDVTGMGYNGILWDVVEWNIMAYAGMYINFLGHKNIMRIMRYNLWYIMDYTHSAHRSKEQTFLEGQSRRWPTNGPCTRNGGRQEWNGSYM